MNDPLIFVNDEFIPASKASLRVNDLAIQRGYGIFDFCKTIDHTPIFLDEHIQRFIHSAIQLRLPIRPKEEIIALIHQLNDKNGFPHSGIKLILTGGYSPDGYTIAQPNWVITQTPLQPPSLEAFEKGIRLVTWPHVRQMPDVKTIDYLMAIWLQPHIRDKNADDVLYHRDGLVSECPRSNFFIVTKDQIVVTPSENILKGVIRGKVLTLAQPITPTEERSVSLDDIRNASEAFITSTTKHIIPVLQIDDQPVGNGSPGRISRRLREQLDRMVASIAG
ncbi:MAG TPA: aminotransferase class IV [Puia sp.]|nr:aminotransferase class IV [Puia sp.]